MKINSIAKTAFINNEGNVLLLRRSKSDPRRPGEWDFPGGQIDEGEDFVAGASREIKEETGLFVPLYRLKLVYAASIAYETESVNRMLFTTHYDKSAINLSFEHDQFIWVSINKALQDFPHPFYSVGLKYAHDHDLL